MNRPSNAGRPDEWSVGLGGEGVTITARLPKRPEWQVEATLVRDNEGRWVTRDMKLSPVDEGTTPTGGVTSLLLRDVPLASLPALLARDRALLRPEDEGKTHIGDLVDLIHGPGTSAQLAQSTKPRGRPRRPDLFYAEKAAEYVETVATTARPIPQLAKAWGYEESGVRQILATARSRGLLTRPGRGLAGGELTNDAKTLLLSAAKETNP